MGKDLWVGNTITVASVGFRILRPDEYSLSYMEGNPKDFPFSDSQAIATKLKSYCEREGVSTEGKVWSPEELQQTGCLVDQEIITLLRKYASQDSVQIDSTQMFN